MTILGALMMVGLDGKVEYIIQYDGVPMNPFNQSEPSLTTWGGNNVDALAAGFSKHRNMYYSYQKCEASPYKPAGLPKTTVSSCTLAFHIDEPVPNAVLRYRIDNMYYGDARFYLSFSPKQIQYGLYKTENVLTEKILNSETGADGWCSGGVWTGLNGVAGGARGIGVPCGNRAHAMFNDEFSAQLVQPGDGEGAALQTQELVMDAEAVLAGADFMYTNTKRYDDAIKEDKALPEDITYLYQMQPDVVDKKKGVEDPHFRVWMRIEAFPTFQKPYAKFTEQTDGFAKDDVVVINVDSRYDVASYNGTKYVVLAADSVDGAAGILPVANIGAPIIFLVLGVLFIILGMLVFLCKCSREDDGTPTGKLKVNVGCFCREYKHPCRHKDDAE